MTKLRLGATSHEFLMIFNLKNTALDHQKNCGINCDVSLYLLKDAAKFIRNAINNEREWEEADKMINEMPTI